MNQKGYTLIELMMVVAIIGVLAAIAVPLYLNYSLKTRVTVLYGTLADGKTGFEVLLANGGAPASPADIALADVAQCSALTVSATGIRCEIQGLGAAVDGKTLALERAASTGAWSCRSDVPAFYLPAGCGA
ncbi:pilin [Craterilacuibacter sp. RT1T]|uniref:pilin n=1 Tax=Craterilacuibacter sp. RT1T TaxID=2942211 RepID=UPI0024BE4775|nr:pilin [Craterilacuibacter sp. RT1T]